MTSHVIERGPAVAEVEGTTHTASRERRHAAVAAPSPQQEFLVPDHTPLIAQYIASWNETDDTQRRALITATFTEDVVYTDPLMRGTGHDELAGLMRGVQARFPGFRFALTRPAERVDDRVRFSWQLGPAGAPALVEGTDFARVADDGRLATVHGFLDRVPDALAASAAP